jgi:site-specific recombinase XerC
MTTQLEGLLRVFGPRAPAQLDRKTLLEWQATLGRTSPSTRRKYLSTVRQFCRWLIDEGHLDSDPTAGLAKIREPRRVPRAIRRTDVAALLQACRTDRDLAVVWLMVGCGLRCTEISGLDLADYDRDAHKGGYERLLPVPTEAVDALEVYLAQRGWTAGPLFQATGSKGAPDGRISARWISKSIGRRMTAAGVHQPKDGRTAHALRHTAASDVLETCRNVRIVQQMLGHTSLQTTQIYLRAANLDDLRTAMEGRAYGTSS